MINEKQILADFKKGLSKNQIVISVFYREKGEGRQITKRQAQAIVEEIMLRDYLRAL